MKARKHIVKTAAFWYNAAKAPDSTDDQKSPYERVEAMENAYNHVENALAAVLKELGVDLAGENPVEEGLKKIAALKNNNLKIDSSAH